MANRSFDVFLSYSKNDGRSVEILAKKLRRRGLTLWLDKWNLVPGVPWQPEIERALSGCLSCAVLIGKSGIGPWQNEEMRAALRRRVTNKKGEFRVIPVLLPEASRNGDDALPSFLVAATWVEFSNGLGDRQALHRLVSGIRGLQPGFCGREEPQTEWVLVLSATFDDVTKPVAEAILEHLRELTGDATLIIKKIARGSVRITLRGSTADLRRLQALATSGRLAIVLGMSVTELAAVEPDASVAQPSTLSDQDLVPFCAISKDPKFTDARLHTAPDVVPFRTHLPRYSLAVAAGLFLTNPEEIVADEWIESPPELLLDRGHVRRSHSRQVYGAANSRWQSLCVPPQGGRIAPRTVGVGLQVGGG